MSIYKTLQRSQTSVWDSQANHRSPRGTTSETEVSAAKHELSKCEYKGTQQDLHQH